MVGTVLLWFMLSLVAAIASPIVHPQALELVCTSIGSLKVVVHTDSGAEEQGMGHLDCPLCVLAGPPPAMHSLRLPALLPLGRARAVARRWRPRCGQRGSTGQRGPPSLS
jgi:hypothetical protein